MYYKKIVSIAIGGYWDADAVNAFQEGLRKRVYKITITLKKSEQQGSGQLISVIREYKEFELDRTWHFLNVKCEEKWGRKLNSFDCVRISKRSPDYLKYIKDLQHKKYNKYDDLLSTDYIPRSSENNPTKIPVKQAVNGRYRDQKE
ncbi:MAG TPA: hypothetical protein VII44_11175 [Puia sp.]